VEVYPAVLTYWRDRVLRDAKYVQYSAL